MFDQFIPEHPSLKRPGKHLRWKLGIAKGILFQLYYSFKILLPGTSKVQFGKRISIQGCVRIKGPGTVIIEDNVIIGDGVDLYTHASAAVIRIGKNTFLNGSRMSSAASIEIGSNNIIADVRIMDTDFHWLHRDRMTDQTHPPVAPIKTENNVWVSAGSAILKGVVIEENSVVAFGSIVTSRIPRDEIWGGVPAKKLRDLPLPGEK